MASDKVASRVQPDPLKLFIEIIHYRPADLSPRRLPPCVKLPEGPEALAYYRGNLLFFLVSVYNVQSSIFPIKIRVKPTYGRTPSIGLRVATLQLIQNQRPPNQSPKQSDCGCNNWIVVAHIFLVCHAILKGSRSSSESAFESV